MIVTIVKIIVNQQNCIFYSYIARRIHCAIDYSCVRAGVFE